MTDLDIYDLRTLRLAGGSVLAVAIEEAKIVVVGLNRPEHVIPDDLDRDFGIVGVDEREGLPRDVTHDRTLVARECDLRRIFLGRILIRRRPIDSSRGDDLHRHPLINLVENAGRDEVFDLRLIL